MSEEKCFWMQEDGKILFVCVDDSIIAYDKKLEKKALCLQERLSDISPIKKLGEANTFLGIKNFRDCSKRKMWLVHDKYAERISKLYNINPNE